MEWSATPPLIDNIIVMGYSQLVRNGTIEFEDYVNAFRQYITDNPALFYQSSRSGLPKFRYKPDILGNYRTRHAWASVRSRTIPNVRGFFQLKNSALRIQGNAIRNQKQKYGLDLDFDGYKRVIIKTDNFIDSSLAGVSDEQLVKDNIDALPDWWGVDNYMARGLTDVGLEIPDQQGQWVLHEMFCVKHVEVAKDFVLEGHTAPAVMETVKKFFSEQGKELAAQVGFAYNLHSDPRFQSDSVICTLFGNRGKVKIYAKALDRIRMEIMVEGQNFKRRGGMSVNKVLTTHWKTGTLWENFVNPIYETFPIEGILDNSLDVTEDLMEIALIP